MPSPYTTCQVMSSRSQPNQPGFTSPPKWKPQPMYCRSTKAPSLTCKPGRTTALKSTWPQGCGTYQAATKSGVPALVGFTACRLPATALVVQVSVVLVSPAQVVVGVTVDVVTAPASEPIMPWPEVQTSVSGASADTERAPRKPY